MRTARTFQRRKAMRYLFVAEVRRAVLENYGRKLTAGELVRVKELYASDFSVAEVVALVGGVE